MKIVYAIMILIVFLIIALKSVKQIKLHTIIVRQCLLMIDNIEIYLGYNNMNTDEIFHNLRDSNLYSQLSFIDTICNNIDKNLSCYVMNEQTTKCIDSAKVFDNQDKENIKGFLSMLGVSDLNGQVRNCKVYKEFFKRKLDLLEKKESDKCKSACTVILGIGILSAILIM